MLNLAGFSVWAAQHLAAVRFGSMNVEDQQVGDFFSMPEARSPRRRRRTARPLLHAGVAFKRAGRSNSRRIVWSSMTTTFFISLRV